MLFRLNKGDGSLLCEKWSQVGERSQIWDHFEVMLALVAIWIFGNAVSVEQG